MKKKRKILAENNNNNQPQSERRREKRRKRKSMEATDAVDISEQSWKDIRKYLKEAILNDEIPINLMFLFWIQAFVTH